MTPRTLWTIVLKIAGLYIFLQVLYSVQRLFDAIIFAMTSHESMAIGMVAEVLFIISIYLFLIIGFIFRTDWLIDALRLNKGITEEKMELNIHRSIVLQIAIIVTGGLLLIDSLPLLLRDLFNYYQQMNDFNGFKHYSSGGLVIINLVKVFISFFMVTSSRLIVNFIERKRKNTAIVRDQEASPEN